MRLGNLQFLAAFWKMRRISCMSPACRRLKTISDQVKIYVVNKPKRGEKSVTRHLRSVLGDIMPTYEGISNLIFCRKLYVQYL